MLFFKENKKCINELVWKGFFLKQEREKKKVSIVSVFLWNGIEISIQVNYFDTGKPNRNTNFLIKSLKF